MPTTYYYISVFMKKSLGILFAVNTLKVFYAKNKLSMFKNNSFSIVY